MTSRRIVKTLGVGCDYTNIYDWLTGEGRNLSECATVRVGDSSGFIVSKGDALGIYYWNGSTWASLGSTVTVLDDYVEVRTLQRDEGTLLRVKGSAITGLVNYLPTGLRLYKAGSWIEITEIPYFGEIAVLEMRNFVIGSPIDLHTNFPGCSQIGYVHITAAPLYRHNGDKSKGAGFDIVNTGATPWIRLTSYTIIEGLRFIAHTGVPGIFLYNLTAGADTVKLVGNYFYAAGTNAAVLGNGSTNAYAVFNFYSNIVENFEKAYYTRCPDVAYIINNTFINNVYAIESGIATDHLYIFNNIFQGNGTDIHETQKGDSSNNLTDKASFLTMISDSGNTVGMDLLFTGAGNYRLHILYDKIAIGSARMSFPGTWMSAITYYPHYQHFVDCMGNALAGDIGALIAGAHEVVARYFRWDYFDDFNVSYSKVGDLQEVNCSYELKGDEAVLKINKYRNDDRRIQDVSNRLRNLLNYMGTLVVDGAQVFDAPVLFKDFSIDENEDLIDITYTFIRDVSNRLVSMGFGSYSLPCRFIRQEDEVNREPIIQELYNKNPIIIRNQSDGLKVRKITVEVDFYHDTLTQAEWETTYTRLKQRMLALKNTKATLTFARENYAYTQTNGTNMVLSDINFEAIDEKGKAEITLTFLHNYGAVYGY